MMGLSRPLFLYFRLFYFNVQLVDKILPMLGFEPQISGVGSHCSTNWATTTAQEINYLCFIAKFCVPKDKASVTIMAITPKAIKKKKKYCFKADDPETSRQEVKASFRFGPEDQANLT